jgi:hypothetical protein
LRNTKTTHYNHEISIIPQLPSILGWYQDYNFNIDTNVSMEPNIIFWVEVSTALLTHKMEIAGSPQKVVSIYHAKQHLTQEDSNLDIYHVKTSNLT